MTAEPVPVVIDLRIVADAVRRRARVVAVGIVAGALIAAGILVFATPRFDGHAMMLIRTSSIDPTSLVKDKLGTLGELMPSNLGLGGSSDEDLATELALLQSRAVIGAVVDSLRLVVVPRTPNRVPATSVVDSVHVATRFKPVKLPIVAGANRTPQATVWAKHGAEIRLSDREDAIDDVESRLTVRKTGGGAVDIAYRARDSVTAREVPNLVAAIYILRRKTVDRGLNQRRLEFLAAKADSVRGDLRRSADVLADVASRNGSGATPDIEARALAEETGTLEAKLSEIRASEAALDSVVSLAPGRVVVDPRRLAGIPDLLRSPALNDLISQIAKVETDRTLLLASRPESSPQAMALAHARDSLVAQLLPLATSYRQSLSRQRASIERDLGVLHAQLARLPGQSAAVAKEQAELARLSAMNVGMGAQVLSARLAALAEGGDVRLIDEAMSPRRVTFPRPLPTIAICLIGGAIAGLAIALFGVPVTVAPRRLE
jgi:uncharacterized protein involved in exopolysaccharide biosynthesis